MLCRYWIEFDKLSLSVARVGCLLSCGVTARDRDDALRIVQSKIFSNEALPKITKFVENVDVSMLDEKHVLPNMKPPFARGIWFTQDF